MCIKSGEVRNSGLFPELLSPCTTPQGYPLPFSAMQWLIQSLGKPQLPFSPVILSWTFHAGVQDLKKGLCKSASPQTQARSLLYPPMIVPGASKPGSDNYMNISTPLPPLPVLGK